MKAAFTSKQTAITFALLCAFTVLSAGFVEATDSPPSHASEDCASAKDADLLKCYQKDYQMKFDANDSKYRELLSRSKTLLQEALESEAKRKSDSYVDVVRKLNRTMNVTRKEAKVDCSRLAAKFMSQATAAVASVNCRAASEVKLDKELKRLEIELDLISMRAGF